MPTHRTSDYLLVAKLTPSVLDKALIGILIVDGDGEIRYANELAEDLAGRPLAGENVDNLVPPDLRVGHTELRSEFTSGGGLPVRWMGESQRLNIRLLNTAGTEVPVSIGLRREMTEEGRFVFAYITRRAADNDYREQQTVHGTAGG